MRLWFKSKKPKTPKVAEKPKNKPTTEPTTELQKPVAVEEKPKKKSDGCCK